MQNAVAAGGMSARGRERVTDAYTYDGRDFSLMHLDGSNVYDASEGNRHIGTLLRFGPDDFSQASFRRGPRYLRKVHPRRRVRRTDARACTRTARRPPRRTPRAHAVSMSSERHAGNQTKTAPVARRRSSDWNPSTSGDGIAFTELPAEVLAHARALADAPVRHRGVAVYAALVYLRQHGLRSFTDRQLSSLTDATFGFVPLPEYPFDSHSRKRLASVEALLAD